MEHLLRGLNEQQQQAVTTIDGYVRIIAGAGSGKTKTLANRYAYLVDAAGIPAENILCVTFTNKAAQEMKERIQRALQDGVEGPYITTYHGFCVKVLREDIHHVHFPKNFTILDEHDQHFLLQEAYDELGFTIEASSFREVLTQISGLKRSYAYVEPFTTPEGPMQLPLADDEMGQIIRRYIEKQRKYFALDFHDLQNFVMDVFTRFPDVLEKWQERLYYIQVDEFQDSSKEQIKLLDLLSAKHQNLFVVGDPDQAIYTWRGAKPQYLVDFDKQYKHVTTIKLEENYRSTPQILHVSNALIANNTMRVDKELYTNNAAGATVTHIHAQNVEQEMQHIVNEIRTLVAAGHAQYEDVAILYRAHYISNMAEQAFMRAQIPYKVYGGFKFYERAEIKTAISYLRLMVSNDDLAFLRTVNTPRRNIGKSRIQRLKQYAYAHEISLFEALRHCQHEAAFTDTGASAYVALIDACRQQRKLSNSTLLRKLLDESGYDAYVRQSGDQDRIDNLSELLATMVSIEKEQGEAFELEAYLQSVALMTDKEKDEHTNCVKLMTIHTSKGLEFPYVFVVSFTDGVLPNSRALRTLEGLEEERRLTYVAMTRAKKALYISEAEYTNQQQSRLPSRFLVEIPSDVLACPFPLPDELRQRLQKMVRPAVSVPVGAESKIGATMCHPMFGNGTVEEENGAAYIVTFTNGKRVIKKTFAGIKWA